MMEGVLCNIPVPSHLGFYKYVIIICCQLMFNLLQPSQSCHSYKVLKRIWLFHLLDGIMRLCNLARSHRWQQVPPQRFRLKYLSGIVVLHCKEFQLLNPDSPTYWTVTTFNLIWWWTSNHPMEFCLTMGAVTTGVRSLTHNSTFCSRCCFESPYLQFFIYPFHFNSTEKNHSPPLPQYILKTTPQGSFNWMNFTVW